MRHGLTLLVLTIIAVRPVAAHAQCTTDAKMLARDGAAEDQFGACLTISNHGVIIGAPYDDDDGWNSGSAYLFDPQTLRQIAKLRPEGAPGDENFGSSVAASGDLVLIGAPGDGEGGARAGAAYLFDVRSGEQLAKLVPNDGSPGDEFGRAVALEGTTAIIGAPSDDDVGTDTGSAYVFDVSTGEQRFKLLPNRYWSKQHFGMAVAVSDAKAVIGMPQANGSVAFLFDVQTGGLLAELRPSNPGALDEFGASVAIQGSRALVGAPGDWKGAHGYASLFDTRTGQQIARLTASDGVYDDERFGQSVALDGGLAVVGAIHFDPDRRKNAGAAYVYDAESGAEGEKLLAAEGRKWDRFGSAMALRGTTVFIGASGDENDGRTTGSAYMLDLSECEGGPPPCTESWTRRIPESVKIQPIAYDSDRDITVLFREGVTFEWDGAAWTMISASGPPAGNHPMVYDEQRRATVLFDGTSGATWQWDGQAWLRVTTEGPGQRNRTAMAYDSGRGVIVLFGGSDGASLGDTWEWDGDVWRPVADTGPEARDNHAMAYDRKRGVIVLHGGSRNGGRGNRETWEWDGDVWTLATSDGPKADDAHYMTYDSGRGVTVLNYAGDGRTWEWDGSNWAQVGDSPKWGVVTYDSRREVTLAYIGWSAEFDTWSWDGQNWQPVGRVYPGGRGRHAMAYDTARGVTVLFGGSILGDGDADDTWEWDGATWRASSSAGPSARTEHAMAYDAARGETVLFGGAVDGGGYSSETWAWDGQQWTLVSTEGPSPRYGHAMAYDSRREVIVLFGGFDSSNSGETWEWNGAAWMLVATDGPTPRIDHAMACDQARGVIVLQGGREGEDLSGGQTWEWDGARWKVAGQTDLKRYGHAIAYDSGRGAIVMFGGQTNREVTAETWEWNGRDWLPRTGGAKPFARWEHAMAFDERRETFVLFGNLYWGGEEAAETWEMKGRCQSCAGQERIKRASCQSESGKLIVSLVGGTPGGDFTVKLAGGPSRNGTLNNKGKGKAKFKSAPPEGRVTATWGCGAEDRRDYTCLSPSSDACEDAIELALPAQTGGSTRGATLDEGFPACGQGTEVIAPGVWYRVVGTGGWLQADTCTEANFNTKINVYEAGCDEPVCVVGNNNSCGDLSAVTWESVGGQDYWILVHGTLESMGEFQLSVFDTGNQIQCDRIERLELGCEPENARLSALLATTLPEGTMLNLTLDDAATQEIRVGSRGLAEAVFDGVDPGEHRVCVDECEGVCEVVECR